MTREVYIDRLVQLASEADAAGYTPLANGMLLIARVARMPAAVRRALNYAGCEIVNAADEAAKAGRSV